MIDNLIVIAKRPIPGRVKTRLTPPLTPTQAAIVAGAALRDTLHTVNATPARHRLLAFDGDVDGWLPAGWRAAPQPSGGLDRRLVSAFAAASPGSALLVGMDTPQVSPTDLDFDTSRFDACLGLAPDGGYWTIGFADAKHAADAVLGIPMSTAHTGAHQLARLRSLGLRVQLLRALIDVDDIVDAYAVSAQAPQTQFAAALAECDRRAAS